MSEAKNISVDVKVVYGPCMTAYMDEMERGRDEADRQPKP